MRHVLIVGLLAVCPLAGQTVVYPGGPNPTGPSANGIPFSSTFSTDIRYQLHVPAGTLPGTPMVLTGLAFAPTSNGTFNIPSLILSVGHDVGGLSCNMDSNSPDLAVQYTGSHTYTYSGNTWSPLGIPLAFPYDGTRGLVIEFRMVGQSGGGGFWDRDSGTNVTRVYNRFAGGSMASTCSHPVSLGLKPRLTFGFAALLTDTGGGGGTLQLFNVPSGTVEGATFFSFNTTQPAGSGSFFGLSADPTTSLLVNIVLGTTASPGNPVHWSWPVSPPLFPAAPFTIPQGVFPQSTTVDAVAVTLDMSLNLVSSSVTRATFN